MTSTQTSKFNAYNRIAAFLIAFAASFTGLIRLLKAVTDFTTAFNDLKKLLPVSTASPSMPVTMTKNELFTSVIDQVLSLANRAYLFASDTASNILMETFHVEKSTFQLLAEPEKILLAQNVLIVLNANSVALIAGYDITEPELLALGNKIKLAQAAIASPSATISSNKAANDAIVAAFLKVDEKILLLGKSIYGKFISGPSANATLINNFNYAKDLSETVSHTTLAANVKNIDGIVIEGALISILIDALTKEAKTDISGDAEIMEFHPGTYHVTFSAIGYISQTKTIKFLLGKTTSISIILLKA